MINLLVPQELANQLNARRPSKTPATDKWLKTYQATLYCVIKSERPDLDWHSMLLENRRQQTDSDMESIANEDTSSRRRGNAHKLGRVDTTALKGSTCYAMPDLDKWLDDIVPSLPPRVLH